MNGIKERAHWLVFTAVMAGAGYLLLGWPEKRAELESQSVQTRLIQAETARLRAEWRDALQPVCDQWERAKLRGVRLSDETNTSLAASCARCS